MGILKELFSSGVRDGNKTIDFLVEPDVDQLSQFNESDVSRDSAGRFAEFSSGHKKHSVPLHRDKSQVDMGKAIQGLAKSGFHVGSEETHPKTQKKFRYVSNSRGDVERMTDAEVVDLAHSHGSRFTGDAETPKKTKEQVHTDIHKAIQELEPSAHKGAMFGAADLRKKLGMNKQEFDAAIWQMVKAGTLAVHQHDFPSGESQESLDGMVSRDAGEHDRGFNGKVYYNAITVRQN